MKKQKCMLRKETWDENGDKIYLCYFITKGEDGAFGVGIDMYTQSAHRRTERERKSVNNIFSSRTEAVLFMNMLAEELVTPISLNDVIEDKIFEKIEKNTCIC